ncbi:hypothetical protein AVEN_20607-1 [Araneus ventricosus]|uniref:Uncharacterized protein n=1 Tax=Araneus ventricosus TaxID=182803 RepID=A0A4Y2VHD6_ARAVE|nr:hypothetical protein AVEN_20607-1 [Araneus ventricosus]
MMKQIKTKEEMMKTRINARWEHKYSELQAEKGKIEEERDALKIEHVSLEAKYLTIEKELSEWKNLFKSELSEWKKVFMEQHSNTLGIIAAMIRRLFQNSSHT